MTYFTKKPRSLQTLDFAGFLYFLENPAALTPYPHTNLRLNVADLRGSIIMVSPH